VSESSPQAARPIARSVRSVKRGRVRMRGWLGNSCARGNGRQPRPRGRSA
jgi:hypothetical protein